MANATAYNPAELAIDLQCLGMRIDDSCTLEQDARMVTRTRAGLGSGLEIIIEPGLYINIPVVEDFAKTSPYRIFKDNGAYFVDKEGGPSVEIKLPKQPEFYTRTTSTGTQMSRIGVLQGTYLGIYPAEVCGYWKTEPQSNCKFCSTGLNVGTCEAEEKRVEDVVETAKAARDEGVTFVHFNAGYLEDHAIDVLAPYMKAVKHETGMLVGLQVTPMLDLTKYDKLKKMGIADHLSFCFEFFNPEYFERYCPGKAETLGQQAFFNAMEHCSKLWGKGKVSGEIIAGIEPIQDTLDAIDYIASVGAFPTVCIFRPLVGTELEETPPPKPEDMRLVMKHMYEACMKNAIPLSIAPNIQVSLIIQPDDGRFLVPHDLRYYIYKLKLSAFKAVFRPYFRTKMWLKR